MSTQHLRTPAHFLGTLRDLSRDFPPSRVLQRVGGAPMEQGDLQREECIQASARRLQVLSFLLPTSMTESR